MQISTISDFIFTAAFQVFSGRLRTFAIARANVFRHLAAPRRRASNGRRRRIAAAARFRFGQRRQNPRLRACFWRPSGF